MSEEQTEAEQTERENRRRRRELRILLCLLPVFVVTAAFSTAFTLERGNADTGTTVPEQGGGSSSGGGTVPEGGSGQGGGSIEIPGSGGTSTGGAGPPGGGSTAPGSGTTGGGSPGGTSPGGTSPGGGSASGPAMPVITSGPSSPTNDTRGTFVFGSSDATSFLCSIDGAAYEPCSSPSSYGEGAFAEGTHTLRVKAVSPGGTSQAAAYTWVVDLTAPPAPVFAKTPADPSAGDVASFEFGDSEAGARFECSLDGASYAVCTSPVALTQLSSGAHTFCVRAFDAAGNGSAATCSTWQQAASGGGGDGGGGTGPGGAPYTIGATITGALRPGDPPALIDLTFSNPNAGNGGSGADGVRVSNLQVEILSVTGPNITGSRPCSAADFALTQFGGAYPFYVPQGTSSLSSLGFASGIWPTIALLDRSANQDGCKGAVVHLSFAGTA